MQNKSIYRKDGFFSLLVGTLMLCALVVILAFVLISFFASRASPSPQPQQFASQSQLSTDPELSIIPTQLPNPTRISTLSTSACNGSSGAEEFADKSLGFTFEYSHDLLQLSTLLISDDSKPDYVIRRAIELQRTSSAKIDIMIWRKPKQETLEAWSKRVISWVYLRPNQPDHQGPSLVGGERAISFYEPGVQSPPFKETAFMHGDLAFLVRYMGLSTDVVASCYDRALSSWRFGTVPDSKAPSTQ